MGRLLTLTVVLALAAGCGGSDDAGGDGETPTGPVAIDTCLGERGFALRPTASGVSATTASGVDFTIALFPTPAAAAEAADAAGGGSTAVETAVVTPSGKQLSRNDLEAIEECVRGSS